MLAIFFHPRNVKITFNFTDNLGEKNQTNTLNVAKNHKSVKYILPLNL